MVSPLTRICVRGAVFEMLQAIPVPTAGDETAVSTRTAKQQYKSEEEEEEEEHSGSPILGMFSGPWLGVPPPSEDQYLDSSGAVDRLVDQLKGITRSPCDANPVQTPLNALCRYEAHVEEKAEMRSVVSKVIVVDAPIPPE